MEIFSDASLTGWGAFCGGERARGHWTQNERHLHINYLELLAAFFGLKCFAENMSNCQILLRIDNTTAISYINKMEFQFKHLNHIARQIWQWCESKKYLGFCILCALKNERRSRRSLAHSSRKLSSSYQIQRSGKS